MNYIRDLSDLGTGSTITCRPLFSLYESSLALVLGLHGNWIFDSGPPSYHATWAAYHDLCVTWPAKSLHSSNPESNGSDIYMIGSDRVLKVQTSYRKNFLKCLLFQLPLQHHLPPSVMGVPYDLLTEKEKIWTWFTDSSACIGITQKCTAAVLQPLPGTILKDTGKRKSLQQAELWAVHSFWRKRRADVCCFQVDKRCKDTYVPCKCSSKRDLCWGGVQ